MIHKAILYAMILMLFVGAWVSINTTRSAIVTAEQYQEVAHGYRDLLIESERISQIYRDALEFGVDALDDCIRMQEEYNRRNSI